MDTAANHRKTRARYAGHVGRELCDDLQQCPSDHCSDHQHIAMGKIDQVEHTVHHGVPQRDQRIHAAQHEAIQQLLYQNLHRVLLLLFER